ncbi:asparaginase [Wenxinia marina]|uniref:L-asparaginase II n=2 Tax=Wenxinia TaxID=653686 RepID=A0A0D0PHM3_9RHOB|nr:L-asparaginase II [Wenxinia marina DSM 24838]
MIRGGGTPCQIHNNCSGKHAGFLTLNRHLGGGADYVDPDHPVQQAVRAAWEEVCGEESPNYGIDGCSAPNFATSLIGTARAMASFATARGRSGTRAEAQARLMEAMLAHPELIHGEGGACTRIMRAAERRAAVKGGAEGFYVAMLPEAGLGVALKITDGGDRAKDVAIAAILHRLGALPDGASALWDRTISNWAGIETGRINAVDGLA